MSVMIEGLNPPDGAYRRAGLLCYSVVEGVRNLFGGSMCKPSTLLLRCLSSLTFCGNACLDSWLAGKYVLEEKSREECTDMWTEDTDQMLGKNLTAVQRVYALDSPQTKQDTFAAFVFAFEEDYRVY